MRTLAPYPLPPPPPLEPPPLHPARRIILAPLQPLLLLRLEPLLPRGTNSFVLGLSFTPPPVLHSASSRSIVLVGTLTRNPSSKVQQTAGFFTLFGGNIRKITKNPGRQGTHGTIVVGLPSSSQTFPLPLKVHLRMNHIAVHSISH